MNSINFLPWRHRQRTKQLILFYIQITLILLACITTLFIFNNRLLKENQIMRKEWNNVHEQEKIQAPRLKQTVTLLETKTKLIALLKRSIVLHQKNEWLLNSLVELSKQITPGITIKKIYYQGTHITLTGQAL